MDHSNMHHVPITNIHVALAESCGKDTCVKTPYDIGTEEQEGMIRRQYALGLGLGRFPIV